MDDAATRSCATTASLSSIPPPSVRRSRPAATRPGQVYARCILFDYSYKYFYNDGYGKEYRILNLEDDTDEAQRQPLSDRLPAGLLPATEALSPITAGEFRPFLLEQPLWIFVGGSVNAVRTQDGRKVSDVIDILLFLAEFAKPEHNTGMIA